MEWEKKTEMIRLNRSEENPCIWQNYVRLHVDEFDAQAWDMFITIAELIPEDMLTYRDFWTFMYGKIHEHKVNEIELSLRTAMRFSMLEAICEESLGVDVIEW